VNVLVVSDTHLGSSRAQELVHRLGGLVEDADMILHTGDITDRAVLDTLAAFAPVHAVLGNNDHGLVLPERRVIPVAGCTVAMVHDSGQAAGRGPRLRRWFPDADVVLFGHSHLPWHETDLRSDGHVQHHVNPGSAVQRRAAPDCTVAVLDLDDSMVCSIRHVVVPFAGGGS
jgi:putative phosphoesterase